LDSVGKVLKGGKIKTNFIPNLRNAFRLFTALALLLDEISLVVLRLGILQLPLFTTEWVK